MNLKLHASCNFNRLFENEGLLKVIASHVIVNAVIIIFISPKLVETKTNKIDKRELN